MSTSNPPPDTSSASKKKTRQRLARAALLKQLNRIKKVCGTLETPDQWYEAVKEVQGVLDDFGDVIPTTTLSGIDDALKLTDPTRTGLQKACEVLGNRLTDAINALPGGGVLAPVALAASLVIAAVVFVSVVYLNSHSVELNIVNQNCGDIVIAGQFPGLDWVGMELPFKPIPPNTSAVAWLAPVTLTINAADPANVRISVAAATIPVGNSAGLQQATLDGISLLGKITLVNLGERPRHELITQCK